METCSIRFLCLAVVFFLGFNASPAKAVERELRGAGATFPLPFYHRIFDAYFRQTGIKIHYQGIGSGGGISQIIERKIDFGGTDAFMTPQEMKEAGAPVIHIPTCLGAVALTYNLPENPMLRFTPGVLADIFLGKIQRWDDQKIAAINGEAKLPAMNIRVVHRSDGSGTTHIFSEYLSKTISEWQEKVGTGKSLNWPVGTGAKGNPGVAGSVKQIPGSIGYVELIYALGNDMTVGAVKNRNGRYISPTPDSVSLAAEVPLPDDTHISLTDTHADNGYPISSFTWLVLYREQNYAGRNKERAEEVVKLLRWIIRDGQKFARPLHYAPLSPEAASKANHLIEAITYGGHPLTR
ncbi:MAG: phosphate ABC transporter substrate-binding protein PstS [Syntrophaceae bacterium]|nr:phosphate ABC transporter substrate-binding protein PstS [Syntrophaceae bacterium]